MLMRRFINRREAGKQLAQALLPHIKDQSPIILALPRGGIPIGVEISKILRAPFEVLLLKKASVAGNEDLPMSAVASSGVDVIMHELKERLGISPGTMQKVAKRELRELTNLNRLYSDGKKLAPLLYHTVILVTDGITFCADIQAAILAVRHLDPHR